MSEIRENTTRLLLSPRNNNNNDDDTFENLYQIYYIENFVIHPTEHILPLLIP